jgi:beta-lactamase superfamily II metal-dependent hydrolase
MRMLRRFLIGSVVLACVLGAIAHAKAAPSMRMYFVDVEGGQATLIVSPSGESLLIDTGWSGFDGRDADRIVKAAHEAGLKQIDYVLVTHYHVDHVGGVPQLASRIKIGAFVDHGPNLEDSGDTRRDYAAYQQVVGKGRHLVVKPGDGLPLKGITVRVVSAAGDVLDKPLPLAGEANPYCATEPKPPTDATENARSLGVLITYGKFRALDLGDLTKDRELRLACPNNLLGRIDLWVVTHHGYTASNAKALVWALRPRVAIMDNGAHKGASADAWETVHGSPGLEDLWQLHYAVDGGKDHNVAEGQIANLEGGTDGNGIVVTIQPDSRFEVENTRNQFRKEYEGAR